MAGKDPAKMKAGEVEKAAHKAGIKDTDDMNKDQMLQAMAKGPAGGSQPSPSGGSGRKNGNRK